jgi:hypothetical protein
MRRRHSPRMATAALPMHWRGVALLPGGDIERVLRDWIFRTAVGWGIGVRGRLGMYVRIWVVHMHHRRRVVVHAHRADAAIPEFGLP